MRDLIERTIPATSGTHPQVCVTATGALKQIDPPFPAVEHPSWCDPKRCTVPVDIDPAFPEGVWHVSSGETWQAGDTRITLRTIRLDEPSSVDVREGEHLIFMDLTSSVFAIRDGDVMLTVQQATELIRRLQVHVDLAGE